MTQIPARARITGRLRQAAGHRVRDAGSTVIQAARDLHLSWSTVIGRMQKTIASTSLKCRAGA
ncbi:transposase family protein [Streptomyces sp. NPDC059680]|uniref:transposase family protein n=1 Tax=Streptomyces sp. NPDC059680 TaxID=3346904 RepID=UPI00367A40B8